MKKRIISLFLLVCLLVTGVGVLTLTANAAGQVYYKIDFSSAVLKSGIGQRVRKDCAVVSMATVEAYLYGATTQAEKNKIYDAVVSTNTRANYAYWSKVGYVTAGYGNFSLQKIYDELAKGYPVIVHRTGKYAPEHWSVVCGYTGSTSKLEESGFQVVDVRKSGTYGKVVKMNLTQWKGKETLDNYARRKSGLAFTGFSGIRFAVNHPQLVHPTGNGHGVYGRVVSNSNLTSVNVAVVKAADGATVYSKTVKPNAKSYNVYNLDSEMTFAKWSAGKYYYVITAQDASGAKKIYTKYFTIGSSWPSSAPPQPVYTFAYNANGGTGSMGTSTVTYNQSATLAANAFTRDGYSFAGWNVQRGSDGRWHTAGQGWKTQAEITANGYTKSLYADKLAFTFNTSWIKSGGTGSCTYTFYAVWQKEEHSHSYLSVVTAPTCTEQGYTTHLCTTCGDSYVDTYVDELGHAWDGGVVTKQPTATEKGEKTYSCKRCDAILVESVPATGVCDGGAGCPSAKFIDVSPKAWYHSSVDFAVERGLFGGASANTFEPETAMTRAMLVTVLWRYEGSVKAGENDFVDVPNGKYYTDAVAWAAVNGIVGGVGNGRFDPEGKITREQMATILYRYAQWKGIETEKRADLGGFPDANRVSSWALDAMRWAVAEGIIGGSDGKLLPEGSATRAQVAAILTRFIQNLAE